MSMASWRQTVVRLAKLLRPVSDRGYGNCEAIFALPSHHQEYELFVSNETIKDLLLVKMRPLLKKEDVESLMSR